MGRPVLSWVCICALSAVPLVGCSEDGGQGGSGGTAGTGGMASRECSASYDCYDGEECTTDACAEGVCGHTAVVDGTDCDGGNECTVSTCLDGACDSTPVGDGTVCDENNECTVGRCTSGVCEPTPVVDGTACGDGAGACEAGSCQVACTEQGVRDAIAAGGGPYTFDCEGPTTVAINGNINLEKDLILDGEGLLTFEGGAWGSEVDLELRGLTFSNPRVISGVGSLTMIDSRVTGSESGIYGWLLGLTIRNTVISGTGSTAIVKLGATPVFGKPAIIEYTTVEGNSGGGITNDDRVGCGPLTIRNTTVSENSGSGLALCGVVTVSNSTLSGNSEDMVVGGCTPRVRITNSTVSGGIRWISACSPIYRGSIEAEGVLLEGNCGLSEAHRELDYLGYNVEMTSLDYNIESPGNTCGFDQATDQVNVTAEQLNLGPLQDNGGPTMTHALLPGSVAIDWIPAEDCVDADGAPLTTDQRGEPRPGGTMCDVGAFEVQP